MTFGDWIKRILKIALPIIVALFVIYHLLFYTVSMPKELVRDLNNNYGEYVLFTVRRIDWLWWIPDNFWFTPGEYSKVEKNVVLFRWNADALERKLKSELREELESLKKYLCVTGYTYDEDNFIVDVYMDESKAEALGEYWDVYSYVHDVLDYKFSLLGNFCKRVGYGCDIHRIENDKEDVYAENELKCLEEILSRSKQEKPADVKKWEGAEWGEDETEEGEVVFYFTRLDLSEYPDISGELDLSKFEQLEYVSLGGMEISKVILPDTLEYIDEKSFKDCKNLEEIEIPQSVGRFDTPVFSGCEKLKKVIFEGDAPETAVILSDGQRIYKAKKVFGEVSEDFTIYYAKASDGWDNKCWKQYHMEVLE